MLFIVLTVTTKEEDITIETKQFGWMKYFQPTKRLRQYLMLESLSKPQDAHVTQRQIAQISGISPSVVNQYLGEFYTGKLMERSPINQRDFSYSLTRQGRAQQREMMVEYIRETFQLFSAGKKELAKILKGYQAKYGIQKVVFYSAGVVTELLLHALQETSMSLLAIVDDDRDKQGRKLFGHPIIGAQEIAQFHPDAVIITTFRYRHKIRQQIASLHPEKLGIKIIEF